MPTFDNYPLDTMPEKSDLLAVQEANTPGKPTKSLTLEDLGDFFITSGIGDVNKATIVLSQSIDLPSTGFIDVIIPTLDTRGLATEPILSALDGAVVKVGAILTANINKYGIYTITPQGSATYRLTHLFGDGGNFSDEDWGIVPFGNKGDKGDEGATGAMGNPGIQGETGPQGSDGPTGPKGADSTVEGPQGPQGEQGEKGSDGDQGLQGEQGDIGPQGDTGLRGSVGPTGATGSKGDTGSQGAKGDQGDSITGPQGVKGDTGADSTVPGPTGPQGVKGDSGADGAKGDTGADGIQGLTGDAGADGATGAQGIKGDTGADSTVAGPTGAKGDTGDAGSTGAKGDTGAMGETGAKGSDVSYTTTTGGAPSEPTEVMMFNDLDVEVGSFTISGGAQGWQGIGVFYLYTAASPNFIPDTPTNLVDAWDDSAQLHLRGLREFARVYYASIGWTESPPVLGEGQILWGSVARVDSALRDSRGYIGLLFGSPYQMSIQEGIDRAETLPASGIDGQVFVRTGLTNPGVYQYQTDLWVLIADTATGGAVDLWPALTGGGAYSYQNSTGVVTKGIDGTDNLGNIDANYVQIHGPSDTVYFRIENKTTTGEAKSAIIRSTDKDTGSIVASKTY